MKKYTNTKIHNKLQLTNYGHNISKHTRVEFPHQKLVQLIYSDAHVVEPSQRIVGDFSDTTDSKSFLLAVLNYYMSLMLRSLIDWRH